MSVLGLGSGYMVKYKPLVSEVPSGFVLGTPSGKGLYLTVYPLSRPNTDTAQMYAFQAGTAETLILPDSKLNKH